MAYRSAQLSLSLPEAPERPKRGGKRKNAGRKRVAKRACVRHRARPVHEERHPIHVTLRVRREVGFLRKERILREVVARLKRACEHFRVVHFSVQSDHLHLLVEAADAHWLARKMTGLTTWLARKVNALLGRRGAFFADRYHRRDLYSPSEVRGALLYILKNRHKHEFQRTGDVLGGVDAYSSAAWLADGWSAGGERTLARARRELARTLRSPPDEAPLPVPKTWLAKGGWRRGRGGRLGMRELPAVAGMHRKADAAGGGRATVVPVTSW